LRIRATLPLAIVLGFFVGTVEASAQNTTNSGPIDEQSFVTIGGIEQWVTILVAERGSVA